MPDFTIPASITMIFGQGSGGKSELCLVYLMNMLDQRRVACIFIFDDRGLAAQRLRIRPCGTVRECELALAGRIVCFNPHIMFPGAKLVDGFRWFCQWAFDVSKRGPGRKILYAYELWQWSHSRKPVPAELENVIRTGRT